MRTIYKEARFEAFTTGKIPGSSGLWRRVLLW